MLFRSPALGVVIDGCPPRVPLDLAFLRAEQATRGLTPYRAEP